MQRRQSSKSVQKLKPEPCRRKSRELLRQRRQWRVRGTHLLPLPKLLLCHPILIFRPRDVLRGELPGTAAAASARGGAAAVTLK